VTETERAEQVAAGPRRRFVQNVALAVALVLGLAGVLLGWHELDQRAQTAETSAVSLAEQVQDACESQGSLDLDGRDLCQQADDVVEDPAADRVPVDGRDGVDGVDGEDGTDGTDGRDGKPGQDGKDGQPGADGVDGEDGTPGSALPGTYTCPDGEHVVGFTIAADGAVELDCQARTPPVIEPPVPTPTPTS